MRNTPFLLLIVVALLLTFSGCKKKDTAPACYMRAMVNNTECNVSDCIALSSGNATIIKGVQQSSSSNYAYIALSIQKSTLLPGEIKFVKTPGSYANVFNAGGSSSISQNAVVQITEVSGNTISGTFNFTCTDGTEVTTGTFTAKRM